MFLSCEGLPALGMVLALLVLDRISLIKKIRLSKHLHISFILTILEKIEAEKIKLPKIF
ncbi:MAG: hypothetical protein KAT74_07665 [Candidatus Cloacimonetes bacterium]|jgi:hypothetical protein|nr:hypothetical protein [Candidatus Cloacimonadota bacterium]